MMNLIIGTRGSKLALWQANFVKSNILNHFPDIEINLQVIKTTGDMNLSSELPQIGGRGVFVKEIEEALLDHKIDIAVHSFKDIPSKITEGLKIGAVMKRGNPFDAFVSNCCSISWGGISGVMNFG